LTTYIAEGQYNAMQQSMIRTQTLRWGTLSGGLVGPDVS
jgi:hypothetical protein